MSSQGVNDESDRRARTGDDFAPSTDETEDRPVEVHPTEAREAEDEPPTLAFRVMRSLLLLASSIVLVLAVPTLAWQSTYLADAEVLVEGRSFEFALVKQHGSVSVLVRDPRGETERVPFPSSGRTPNGDPSIDVESDGRTVLVRYGAHEARFEFRGSSFVLATE